MGILAVIVLVEVKSSCWMIMEKDCQARGLNREDAMDHIRWMKQIRDD